MLEPDGDTAARPGQPGGETLVLDAVQSALRRPQSGVAQWFGLSTVLRCDASNF